MSNVYEESRALALSALRAALAAGTISEDAYRAAVEALSTPSRRIVQQETVSVHRMRSIPTWATHMQITSYSSYGYGLVMPNAYVVYDIAGKNVEDVRELVEDFMSRGHTCDKFSVTFLRYNY